MSFLQQEWAVYKNAVKGAIEWRVIMVMSVLTGPLWFLINYFIWVAVFAAAGKAEISGFTLEQMITYIAVSKLVFYVTWDDNADRLAKRVRRGDLAKYILRPIFYYKTEFIEKLGHRSLAVFLEFIPITIILGYALGWQILQTPNLGYFAITLLIASIIQFQINAILGMLAFWVVEPRGFIRIYQRVSNFLTGAALPLSIFPLWFQEISSFLPFQFVRFVPAVIFMGNYELGGLAFSPLQAVIFGFIQILVMYLLIKLIWHYSIKKYTGVGQ